MSDKASLETFILTSVEQYHKREKFDIPWIFYVLDVNFFTSIYFILFFSTYVSACQDMWL